MRHEAKPYTIDRFELGPPLFDLANMSPFLWNFRLRFYMLNYVPCPLCGLLAQARREVALQSFIKRGTNVTTACDRDRDRHRHCHRLTLRGVHWRLCRVFGSFHTLDDERKRRSEEDQRKNYRDPATLPSQRMLRQLSSSFDWFRVRRLLVVTLDKSLLCLK